VFEEKWKLRNLWETEGTKEKKRKKRRGGAEGEGERFNIRVCARFKPLGLDRPGGNGGGIAPRGKNGRRIALPLHQRLALIRADRGLSSGREALEVLREQGDWFPGKAADEDGADEKKEDAPPPSGPRAGVHFVDRENARAVLVDPTKGLREFQFDHVEDGTGLDAQGRTYDAAAASLVSDFINGYDATCLVYGQTGSGKTHTMFGPPDCVDGVAGEADGARGLDAARRREGWGVVPRACAEVFEAIKDRKTRLSVSVQASLSVSYIEVFGDELSDLLRDGAPCGRSRAAAQRYVLDGSSEMPANDIKEAFDLLRRGERGKRRARTAMNDRSSRAHSVFVLTLRQRFAPALGEGQETGEEGVVERTSRLFLADLGGSEQLKKSQPFADMTNETSWEEDEEAAAIAAAAKGERLREAVNINLGLLALKQCVEALHKRKKNPRRHIPYGDSKLTMLLSPGLGGDGKTCIVVCAAREQEHGAETIAAARFGAVCRGVSTEARSRAAVLGDLLRRIDEAIEKCEVNIRRYERWEVRQVQRVDERAGSDGDNCLVEVRTKTVLVGAEKYREELEGLLQRRAELTGGPMEREVISSLDT